MKILKFGSATIATADKIKSLANIAIEEKGSIVVLSSIKGSSEYLEEISGYLYKKNHEGVVEILNKLHGAYNVLIDELYAEEEFKAKAKELVRLKMDYIRTFTQDLFTLFEERVVMAQGELISADLFLLYLQQQKVNVVLLPALDYIKTDKNSIPDSVFIKDNLNKLLQAVPNADLYLTQGYICRNSYGEIDDLRKGGSDYTAALVGAAIQAEEIQIWEDVEVMKNNDPNYVEGTLPVAQISFDEAAELAYFGAEILHPTRISPAKFANIPVRLKCTQKQDEPGTVITNEAQGTIKAVAVRSAITAIRITSGEMLLAHGFLRRIFEVFEKYQTPIDLLTTSEVGISLTIDDTKKLEYIVDDLKRYGTVIVDSNMAIVSIVGDLSPEKSYYSADILQALRNVSLRMISYGGSKLNLSLLIKEADIKATLVALNNCLFTNK